MNVNNIFKSATCTTCKEEFLTIPFFFARNGKINATCSSACHESLKELISSAVKFKAFSAKQQQPSVKPKTFQGFFINQKGSPNE